MDYESRSAVCSKKKQRARLIALAAAHEEWIVGFCDEVWWSRFAQPSMHGWSPQGQPLRLVGRRKSSDDTEAKALACYGLLLEDVSKPEVARQMLLRFVRGRPVSHVTCGFLEWACDRLMALGKTVCVLVWDNASWHISAEVRTWIAEHNRQVKRNTGVRLLVCGLPTKSPWLNPIEPTWLHGKRAIAEADGPMSTSVVMQRVCAHFGCEQLPCIQQNTP